MTTLAPGSPAREGCAPTPEAHAMPADAAARFAVVLKALADPVRLRVLSYLTTSSTGEACVCDLATVADLAQPTVSHHLKVLRDAGVLTCERRGTWVHYRVAPGLAGPVTALLESFAPAALEPTAARPRVPMARSEPPAGAADIDATLDRVADELAHSFPDASPAVVLGTVRESYAALARGAGVHAHVVQRTRRFAAQRLTDMARAADPGRARVPQVLFVCVANAGRSQLAAALMRHHSRGAVVARSAGSAPAGAVHAGVRPLLDALGTDAAEAFPKPLTDDAVRAADVVVTLGCGDTCPVLPGTRYEEWVVGDPALASPEGVAAIRDDLDARVRALLADLVPGHPRT